MCIGCSAAGWSLPGGGRAARVSLPRAGSSPGSSAAQSDPLWPLPCGDSFIPLQCGTG